MQNNKLNNDIIQLSGYIYKNVNNKKPENWESIDKKRTKIPVFMQKFLKMEMKLPLFTKVQVLLVLKRMNLKIFH